MRKTTLATSPLRRVLHLAALIFGLAVLAGCGQDSDSVGGGGGDEAVDHVHGLGIDPADGALLVATHSGLFRSPEGSAVAERVGERSQDTMGFAVVGPNRLLGSGHPGPGEEGPASLGLIESDNAGMSWSGLSLAGEADFHVLHYSDERIYGVNALTGLVMVSGDGGRTWVDRRPPAPVIDLAIDPGDPTQIVASTARGLALSSDEGSSWEPLGGDAGLLSWVEPGTLFLVNAAGQVQLSTDGGRSWADRGGIGGQPAAFVAATATTLYAALSDGTVVSSSDGGVSWAVRLPS